MKTNPSIQLGLRENAWAFSLLVIVNAFVGAMVGVERSVLSVLAVEEFAVDSTLLLLLFIVFFGIAKAVANYLAGRGAQRYGRKNILIAGWILALPIPALIYWAPSWNWILAAQILLGLSQGLSWSSTVIMKIDLVGPKKRGTAMGINESAGYLAVGVAAFAAAHYSETLGYRMAPVVLSSVFAFFGLMLSLFAVRDTTAFTRLEQSHTAGPVQRINRRVIEQAGLINNLNDGLVWGVLPVLLLNLNFSEDQWGWVTGLYPAVWGIGQLATGRWGDRLSKRLLITIGMVLQGVVLFAGPWLTSVEAWLAFSVLLGAGKALVYPNFLAGIADAVSPEERAGAVGRFRFFRDMGYPVGAVVSGLMMDFLGLHWTFMSIGALTVLSGCLVWVAWHSAAVREMQ